MSEFREKPVSGNESVACGRCGRADERDPVTGDMPDHWLRLMVMAYCLRPSPVLESVYLCPACRVAFEAFVGLEIGKSEAA